MLVPVFRVPPRVVCLDHMMGSTVKLYVEFRGSPSGKVDPLVNHLTMVDTLVPTPWLDPPSDKQTICVSPSVDCLKPNNSRVISIKIKIREDTFVQKPNSIRATFLLFPLKKPLSLLPIISINVIYYLFLRIITTAMSQCQAVSNSFCKYLKNRACLEFGKEVQCC